MIERLLWSYDEPDYPEEFKIITYPEVFPGRYVISNHGRVFTITGKQMKCEVDKDYHERIQLCTCTPHPRKRGYKQKHYFIHRLMAWEFLGPPPDYLHNIVNHKNGIPCCNLIHNIEWCTVLENTNHAKQIGIMKNSGIHAKVCKYDEKIIRRICSLLEKGYRPVEVFELIMGNKEYKTPGNNTGLFSLINKLYRRTSYRDIVKDYEYLPSELSFKCDANIDKIRDMIKNGCTNYDILHKFGYSNVSDNPTFYNKIIYERANCEVLFNDYRKHAE